MQTHKDLATDIHHVFPKAWAVAQGIERAQYDSIVNKTPLAARTNRLIGGVAPSQYLVRVERESRLSGAEVDELLASHGLDAGAMRADDFEAHFAHRREYLLALVEEAMGSPVQRETASATNSAAEALAAEAEFDLDDESDDTGD